MASIDELNYLKKQARNRREVDSRTKKNKQELDEKIKKNRPKLDKK